MSQHAMLSAVVVSAALGGIVIFGGGDPGAGIGAPRPNSDAAAAAFDAAADALGTVNVIDFESLPLGAFTTLEIAPGVTATVTGTTDEGGIVADGWFGGATPHELGFNTTLGGSRFFGVTPVISVGTVTIELSFDPPIVAFGTYITGFEGLNSDLRVTFDDGAPQMLSSRGLGADVGGAQFFGFTDAGSLIEEITLTLSDVVGRREIFGLDDMRFTNCGASSYCETSPNSVGPGALISSMGSTSLAANDLTLHGEGLPPDEFALFFYGAGQARVPFGDGLRCVGGPELFRLFPPTPTDGSGDISRPLDYSAPPLDVGSGAVDPGDVWNFQLWYRDPAAMGAGFNLSDGLSVLFCP